MFSVYKIKFKSSKKVYIGYTSKSIAERLSNHIKNALNGYDVKLSRAIRKYGIDTIQIEKIYETYDKKDATNKERYFIEQYDSYRNGYNMTIGGDGGWCVPDEKYDTWKIHTSMPLESNGRWSGYSDEDIALKYKEDFEENTYGWSLNGAAKRLSNKYNNFPKVISKCRFIGFEGKNGNERLIDYLSKKFNMNKEMFKYRVTKEHIKNNSSIKKKGDRWYYNEKLQVSKQSSDDLTLQGWKKGRKLKWD